MAGQVLLLFAVILGIALGWVLGLNRATKEAEQGEAEGQIKLGLSEARVHQLEEEQQRSVETIERLKKQSDEVRGARDQANQDSARLEERASRVPTLEGRITELETALAQAQRLEANLRQELGQVSAELKGEKASLSVASDNLSKEKSRREKADESLASLNTALAELTVRYEGERTQAEEKLALLLEAKVTLSDQFRNLANEILEEKSKRFTEQNRTNLGQLLDPLKLKISEFQTKVEDVYNKESKDRVALGEQVRQLMDLNQSMSLEARNLTLALKGSSKTQGDWGELVLERILEASGLRRGEEYDVQESHTREDGSKAQPDIVIHLPEDRHLVVDAKVSLNAYQVFATTEDEEPRKEALKRHLASVRNHMKGLSEKNYHALYGLKSLDFVLMFVPIEPAFMMAVTHDQDLFMDAWRKNVLLVSPSTLLFVVRTVAHLWRQEAQSRNAQEIAKRGAELYDRLSAFVADLEKVGDRLRQAQESFVEARDKLSRNKGNVIRQALMLKQLGIKPTKSLPQGLVDVAMEEETVLQQEIVITPTKNIMSE